MPGGRPKGSLTKTKDITDAIKVALNRPSDQDPQKRKKIFVLADKLVDLACEGDIPAIKEVIDRTEGKATQAHEHTGAEGEPLSLQIVYKPVSKDD